MLRMPTFTIHEHSHYYAGAEAGVRDQVNVVEEQIPCRRARPAGGGGHTSRRTEASGMSEQLRESDSPTLSRKIAAGRRAGRRLHVPQPAWLWRIAPYAIGALASFWVVERIATF